MRFSRTGLLSDTRFRNPEQGSGRCYSLREVCLCLSGPTCPAQVSFEAAYHCQLLPHVDGFPALRVLRADLTPHGPSARLLFVGKAYLGERPISCLRFRHTLCQGFPVRRTHETHTIARMLFPPGAHRASQVPDALSPYMPRPEDPGRPSGISPIAIPPCWLPTR